MSLARWLVRADAVETAEIDESGRERHHGHHATTNGVRRPAARASATAKSRHVKDTRRRRTRLTSLGIARRELGGRPPGRAALSIWTAEVLYAELTARATRTLGRRELSGSRPSSARMTGGGAAAARPRIPTGSATRRWRSVARDASAAEDARGPRVYIAGANATAACRVYGELRKTATRSSSSPARRAYAESATATPKPPSYRCRARARAQDPSPDAERGRKNRNPSNPAFLSAASDLRSFRRTPARARQQTTANLQRHFITATTALRRGIPSALRVSVGRRTSRRARAARVVRYIPYLQDALSLP